MDGRLEQQRQGGRARTDGAAAPTDASSLTAGLNQTQYEAVTATGGPVVVLAGAGSGKTRVLTRRIGWRIVQGETDPARVLALTFTRKAGEELKARLRTLGLRDRVQAGTFHAIALLQLRQRWAERNVAPPTILDRKLRLLSRLLPSSGSGSRRGSGRPDGLAVMAELDWARARLIDPDHYDEAAEAAGRTPPLGRGQMADLMVRYQQEKRRRRVVDFDDLLSLAVRDLQQDPDYAAAVRWRHRHLYVDEFQDVNPLQFELLRLWRGDRPDLFVVGDPNQAIYGWNGADPGLLDRFVTDEEGAVVVSLIDNYRSTPQVLSLPGALLPTGALSAHRPDGPVPTLDAHPDDRAEAEGIADRIREAHAVAGRWSDQAVLVRTNAQLAIIEQALAEGGIPVRLRGGSGPLATPEVKTELALLSKPGTDLEAALVDYDERLAEPVGNLSLIQIERRANLGAFVRLVHDYVATDPVPTGPGLAAWLATVQADDVDPSEDGVELTTFHGSKGLEWSVVHVAGLEDGFVPIAYATTGAQLAEEKRLLYVALTRARDELHLSWAAERSFGSKPVTRSPSPHLGPLAEAMTRLGVGPQHRIDWRAQLAKSRRALDEAAPPPSNPRPSRARRRNAPADGRATSEVPDEQQAYDTAYRALRGWRARRARAADVPPHAVLPDRTLQAMARARPSSRGGLAAMPGLGPTKLQRYGDELLRLLAPERPPPR